MSTNEQNKKQEYNQNGNQTLEELHFLEEKSPNSEESEKNSEETIEKEDVVHVTFSENEGTVEKVEYALENIFNGVDNKENSQTLSRGNENFVVSEECNLLVNRDLSKHLLEYSISSSEEMSRSNITKSRLPSKATSRSALSQTNSKLPGELSGQPSVKNTKDDVKYWKSREQELLLKIAELESKITAKDSNTPNSTDSAEVQIQEKLKNELLAATREKENYKNRLQMIERELYNKEKEMLTDPNFKSFKSSEEIINHLKLQNEDLRNALAKMTAILRDKTTICISQEKKIAALMNQVESLKEVVAITKDLLNIRNMEVQHLSNDISAMETKIDCERQRHNQMLLKMDEAVKLNCDLKKEYENQLKLFQSLRDSYQEKILLLSRDNVDKKDGLALKEINSNEKV